MFHLGKQYFITCPELGATPAGSHQIDALRGSAGKDDFDWAAGVDKALHFAAAVFVGGGRLLAQSVQAPMYIGVAPFVVSSHGLDYRARLLSRRGVIQIYQGVTPNFAAEYRKLVTY